MDLLEAREKAMGGGSDNMGSDHADIAHLIRSLQRAEGNPDCFRTAENHCAQEDCVWRELCVGKSHNHTGYEMGDDKETSPDSGETGKNKVVR